MCLWTYTGPHFKRQWCWYNVIFKEPFYLFIYLFHVSCIKENARDNIQAVEMGKLKNIEQETTLKQEVLHTFSEGFTYYDGYWFLHKIGCICRKWGLWTENVFGANNKSARLPIGHWPSRSIIIVPNSDSPQRNLHILACEILFPPPSGIATSDRLFDPPSTARSSPFSFFIAHSQLKSLETSPKFSITFFFYSTSYQISLKAFFAWHISLICCHFIYWTL